MSTKNRTTGRFCTVMMCTNPTSLEATLRRHGIPRIWEHTDLPLVDIPLHILRLNVEYTSNVFSDLTRRIEKAENQLMESSEDLNSLIRELNRCNADLLRLETRWNFERKLSATIREVIDEYILRQSSQNSNVKNDQYFTAVLEHLMLQDRLSQSSEYGISILPRRIQNQFSAAYSLIAQRDTKATIILAKESQKLATASLRDSSSMKTIAGMTLLFLPPTFVCTFFSMPIINWDALGHRSLGIYFATATPLTVMVILSWITYNVWRRKAEKKKFKLEDDASKSV
ncbi:hypothetical protein F5X68DRAFT_249344 [Plectosphaerella plurivora]|uniref:Uncharacterized protein n=1 Tax=Plectosphaerella plurivora TaxID=936078 RepID=A0A9P8V2Z9_9PEZI|nr:hypothetical protein F5X68DRAFT_249344 [Plectosphaerella plurivora]